MATLSRIFQQKYLNSDINICNKVTDFLLVSAQHAIIFRTWKTILRRINPWHICCMVIMIMHFSGSSFSWSTCFQVYAFSSGYHFFALLRVIIIISSPNKSLIQIFFYYFLILHVHFHCIQILISSSYLLKYTSQICTW